MSTVAAREALESTYRADARRVLATLIRLLGDFDAAEEAMHDAFAVAADRWPRDGVPENPYAWLVSTGRFRSIDRRRRQANLERLNKEILTTAAEAGVGETAEEALVDRVIPDDELRLLFTCCHPVLATDAQIALTLREVAGLTTEEIARAYVVSPPTIAQRIVRAKAKIRASAVPYEVPGRAELAERVHSVLAVVYLIFNEGYLSTSSACPSREDLAVEALRLGRLVMELLDDPEALGLVALMTLHEARRSTRVDAAGDLVLLEDQDRSRWDRDRIAEAQSLIVRALSMRRVGPYVLQAAIAALHAEAPTFAETDFAQIVSLYDLLCRIDATPVVALNRAVAIAMRDGPEAGLEAVEGVIARGGLDGYALAHAALGDLHRRLGHAASARACYGRALELTRQPAEQRFLAGRLRDAGG